MNPNHVMAYELAMQRAHEMQHRAAQARRAKEASNRAAERRSDTGKGLLPYLLRLALG